MKRGGNLRWRIDEVLDVGCEFGVGAEPIGDPLDVVDDGGAIATAEHATNLVG